MYPLITIAVVLVAGIGLIPLLIHRVYRAPRVAEHGSPADLGLRYRTEHIATANGKTLYAWLVPPANEVENAPAVIVMHGWGGNAEDMLPFAPLLHQAGYAVLLLDARNHGSSDADGFSSLPRFAEDLERALGWLARQPGIDGQRLALLGHSVGAGAALLVASRRHEVAAVISIAAFAHPAALMRRQMSSHHIPYLPIGWLVLRYIERAIGARFDHIAPRSTVRDVTCPVLLVHGADDERAPAADALCIFANRRDERTELLLLPETGHDSRDAILTHGMSVVSFLRRTVGHALPTEHDGVGI